MDEMKPTLFPSDVPLTDAHRKAFKAALADGIHEPTGDLLPDDAAVFGPMRHVEPMKLEAVDDTENTIVYTITSSAIDRYNEIVDPNGIDLTNFRRSKKTVFWNHDYNVPIGKSLWERQQQETWIAKVKFADGVTQLATDIWNLAKAGFVGMTSIGFMPRAWEWTKLDDLDLKPSNRAEYDKQMDVLVWRKSELLEFSVVGIGANPDAIEVERILRSGLVQDSGLRNCLTDLHTERTDKRLCDLEKCGGRMEALPEIVKALETLMNQNALRVDMQLEQALRQLNTLAGRVEDVEQAGVALAKTIQPLLIHPNTKRPEMNVAQIQEQIARALVPALRRVIREAQGKLD